jgi:hypothetical protein
MAIEKLGLNLTALQNIEPINISINTSASQLFAQLPLTANTITHGGYPYVIIIAVFTLFYWILTERSTFSKFKYSYLRGLVIATGLTSLIGISLLTSGYIFMFRIVAMSVLSFALSIVVTLALENKQ